MSLLGKRPPVRPAYIDDFGSTAQGIQQSEHFENLLDNYAHSFKRGDIVKGRVLSSESGGWAIDIGAKMSAFLPSREMATMAKETLSKDDLEEVALEPPMGAMAPGDNLDFFVLREDESDSPYQFVLSRRRVQQAQVWKELETIWETNETIHGTVMSFVKGGLLVELRGLRAFVPSSHIRHKQPLESLVKESLPFKILSMDAARNNIILSHRKVVSENLAGQRKELLDNLNEGALVEGEVVRLTDFGAFIDLGGIDGLLPLSQISWRWVEHPGDVLKIGDKVKVEVIGVDIERNRVSLSIKSQYNDPWTEVETQLTLGQEVEGLITKIKHFGAFIEIYPGIEALLPSKDMLDLEAQTQQKLDTGVNVRSFITKFNPEERRIGLSIYPYEPHQYQNRRPAETAASSEADILQ